MDMLESIIDDLILATEGDLDKMDELITGDNENDDNETNNS